MCPVCSAAPARRVGEYRGSSPALGVQSLMSCAACGLVFASPMPSPAALDEYNSHYWREAHGGLDQTRLSWATDAGLNASRADFLIAHTKPTLDTVGVLEIGPGRGYLMRYLRARWPASRYVAVEADATCHDRLRTMGADEVATTLDSVPAEERFSLVIVSHVLEHVADPIGFLAPMVERLVPGGCLFVETPCRDDTFKPQHEPHLLFFDKPSMEALLTRLGCRDVRTSYHGPALASLRHRPSVFSRAMARWRRSRAEAALASLDLDHLPQSAAASYVRHLDVQRARKEQAWWLRALATKPQSGETA